MEQKELRDFERKCIQEEAPECIAACPIHVDARSFVKEVKAGAWNNARKILEKNMPFPSILGRICDAPCQSRCKRKDAGEAIEIGALEHACVTQPPPPFRMPPRIKKNLKTAILGTGLAGLTAAWDLLRKGYQITVFEPSDEPGKKLKEIYGNRLPSEEIQNAFSILKKMGAAIETAQQDTINTLEFQNKCIQEFDAVFIGLDSVSVTSWELDRDENKKVVIEPLSQFAGKENIFAGGDSSRSSASPVWQAAEGRWAATSIDRSLQKVSMTAGREKEGPFESRLFTQLKDISPLPAVPMADPDTGYTPEEAIKEAQRCIQCQCMECVKVCSFLEAFKGYPKRYTREIYNNESIVMGNHQANKLINSCSLCGLCEQVCPENFAMQDLCLSVRQSMVKRKKMPPSAHEFALLDMAFSQSDRFAMNRHEPGKTQSTYAFFPGCQLCASLPEKVIPAYDYLRQTLSGGVGLMLGCCCAPAHWAGQQAEYERHMEDFKSNWAGLGRPKLILACSTCFQMMKENLNEIELISLWQVFKENGFPASLPSNKSGGPLSIHDPCTTRHEPGIQEAVRNILNSLDVNVEELELSRDMTECCGFGGLMQNANPDIAKTVISKRAEQSPNDYLTYCAMCRDSLSATGKRVIHLLDLLFESDKTYDPAEQPPMRLSQRMENRARLKDELKTKVFNEAPGPEEDHQKIILEIPDNVREKLDARRILEEDLQKVLLHAGTSGKKLIHSKTGHFLTFFKPYHVTFWVEYTPMENNGFLIHNAYAHRMEVIR